MTFFPFDPSRYKAEMKTNERNRQIRTVGHLAATHLERLGYNVLKTTARSLTFDLVAYNAERILFITTRRSKGQQTIKQIIHAYNKLIIGMQNAQAPHSIEIYQPHDEFIVYKLFEYGLIKTQVGEEQSII